MEKGISLLPAFNQSFHLRWVALLYHLMLKTAVDISRRRESLCLLVAELPVPELCSSRILPCPCSVFSSHTESSLEEVCGIYHLLLGMSPFFL